MLSGCPDCGGNKFQFHPGDVPAEPPDDASPPERNSSVGGAVGRAAISVRDFVGGTPDSAAQSTERQHRSSGSESERSPAQAASESEFEFQDDSPTNSSDSPDDTQTNEDRAQADARSSVVDTGELPGDEQRPKQEPFPDRDDETVVQKPTEDEEPEQPNLETIRQELNDQFESIRIVDRGRYELNLMELYDREEYIISLQEDGRYVIEVPDAWEDGE